MLRRVLVLTALASVLGPLSSAASQPNIILITLGSTRADHMGFLGARAKITPSLDALARQCIGFEQAYSQSPSTVVSNATLLTGTYPRTHAATEFGAPLSTQVPFAPELLRARGYRTAAFVGSIQLDPRNGFAPGFDRGFAVYDASFRQPRRGEPRAATVERPASQVLSRATAWLAKTSTPPFFIWVELHDPAAVAGAAYNPAIQLEDSALGKFIAMLRSQKIFDNALIILAADHGQSLGAHGEDTHGVLLYDETAHVPLLLKLPQNLDAGKRVPARVGLVDVAPTLLEIAGVPVPSQMQGQSLLRIANGHTNPDQPVYSVSDFPQRAFGWSSLESWRAGKFLYIRAPYPELYDLATDPGATHNLALTSKATLDTIAAQLNAFDQHFSPAGTSPAPQLTSSEMQKLASLGYVGLQKSAGGALAATGIDPKDGISSVNRVLAALALIDDGKPDQAIAILQSQLAALSKSFLAQFAMGTALAQQQQFSQAVEHLHAAIEIQPDSAWAHYQMGSCLLRNGDYKTAAVHLEIAANRLPEFAGAHSLLAQAYDHLSRSDDSTRERAKAAQLEAAKP